MDKFLKSQHNLHNQMDGLFEPQRKLQEQLEQYSNPQLRVQDLLKEQMDNLFDPQRKLQEQLEQYSNPQLRVQDLLKEQMDNLFDPQRELQEQLKQYSNPQLRIQDLLKEQMDNLLEPQRKFQEQLEKYLFEPRINDISINNDGTAVLGNEVINVREIAEYIEDISENYSSGTDFISYIFECIEKLNDSKKVIAIYIIMPYFLAIFANMTTPIYEEWWKEYSRFEPRKIKKEIVRGANEKYSPESLKGHSFVYATSLHVRYEQGMKSEIIDDIVLGKVVIIILKNKRWSFIEYQDSDTGELKSGWVYSRYLKKLSK